MSHDELKSLIAPYVLGSVSPEETEFVRAHIVACDECMAEADSYAAVVSSLALSVDEEPLPDGFIDRVMARAQEESQDSAVLTAVASAEPVVAATGSEHTVTPLERPRRRVGLLATAAALLLVAALAGSLIVTTNELSDTRSDLEQEREQLIALAEEQGGMRLDDPTGESIGAMLPTQEGGIFLVRGLEDAPNERTYQVWLIEGDQPVSAGTFDPSGGVGTLEIDRSLEGVDAVAVTVEPEGGSSAPTSDPILTS
ncbi:MAG: anti-sigma factor domain-containing protein [Actinomycetota bacterium]